MQSCIFLGEVQFFFGEGSHGISNSDRQKNTITTLKILYCICALHVHQVTAKKHFPPFPAVHNDACVQVTFWQAGHKGMYDILITVYELSPGNQVSSSIYSFAILCFCYDPVQGLLNAYVHYICTSKQILAETQIYSLLVCYMFWAAKPFEQDTRG